jgi:hypothetical protein
MSGEGFYRLILESSPDGLDPWDREVVARGDHAFAAAEVARYPMRCLVCYALVNSTEHANEHDDIPVLFEDLIIY